MRVFTVNLDGTFREMVAAKTKKRALELLGCTTYTFANCGSENDGVRDDEMQMALANPETVYKQRMAVVGAQWFAAGTPEPPPDPLHTASREELIDEVKRLRIELVRVQNMTFNCPRCYALISPPKLEPIREAAI